MIQRNIKIIESPTYNVNIFIAGDLQLIRQTCMKFVSCIGGCVTVTPTEYIYTGGQETGVRIGLINYPRFPKEPALILDTALKLAEKLIKDCHQETATVVTPEETIWLTRRKEDENDGETLL